MIPTKFLKAESESPASRPEEQSIRRDECHTVVAQVCEPRGAVSAEQSAGDPHAPLARWRLPQVQRVDRGLHGRGVQAHRVRGHRRQGRVQLIGSTYQGLAHCECITGRSHTRSGCTCDMLQTAPSPPAAGEQRVHTSSLQIIFDQREMLRVSIPALLYVIQNNLQYVAVSNLDAASFQVLYQLKILTTAIFSVFLLGKSILALQWGAIVILMFGVALVQLDDSSASAKSAGATPDQSTTLGLIAVLAACMCSGFAGVYFEKILKSSGSRGSLWERNIQMGVVSVVLAGGGLLYNDMEHLTSNGFFYGYRPVVWAAICVSAIGGLLTAVVVKYADNILKAFATSIAIVLSVIMSIFLFDKVPTMQFLVGAFFVNVSVYIYGNAASWKQTHSPILPRTVKADKQ